MLDNNKRFNIVNMWDVHGILWLVLNNGLMMTEGRNM